MKKKIVMTVLAFTTLTGLLASCSGTSKRTFDDSTYAGYKVDLNGDGTISDSEKNLTWANSYDAIVDAVKATSDNDKRFKLMHAAETELMSTGCIVPIYWYTDAFMKKENMTGFYGSPLGFKFFEEAQVGGSGEFTACIASAPGTIDPALNSTVDGGTYDSACFEGLYRWSYAGAYPDGTLSLVPGVAKEAPVKTTNSDGTVDYTFTLRDNLKWSDGTSYDANDFVRSWKRSVCSTTAADYAYLFEAIKGGAEAEAEADAASLAVSAPTNNTLKVTLVSDIPYFLELTAFPAFMPVPESADVAGTWVAQGKTPVGNGSMKVTSYTSSSIVLEKNTNYYGADRVKATKVTFAFSADDNAMLSSYKANSYQFIDSVPVDQMKSLATSNPKEFFNVGQLGTYYLCWNVRDGTFDSKLKTEPERESFRKALSLLIDRNYIVDSVANNGATPANAFVSSGLLEPDGKTEFIAKNGENGDGKGYYSVAAADQDSNVASAIATIKSLGYNYDETKKVFTDIPAFDYIYNTGTGHQKIAEYIQGAFAKYGITMNLSSQEWATFVETRKAGDYSCSRNGWLCDYNDPISMLDMWVSNSGNNDVGFGKQPL